MSTSRDLIDPGVAEFLVDSTIIPRSIRPSSCRDSSIPLLLKTFTPENSAGLWDAVTENPSSQPCSRVPNATTGVGTNPNCIASLPQPATAAAATLARTAELFLPSHPIP